MTATTTRTDHPIRPNAAPARADADTAELFDRLRRNRDARAREQLTERFLPLARKLARRYLGAHEPLEDLVQVASVGLVKAIDRYDPSRGTAFASFAVPTILGELKRYFRDLGWAVHVSRGAQELAIKVQEANQELTARDGRPPSVGTLAQYLELPVADVLDALSTARAHHAASLDAPYDETDSEGATLIETFGGPDALLAGADERLTVCAAARQLPARERQILYLRFAQDLTQDEIGERVGISQMQVSRILRQAMATLRELSDA